LTIAEDVITVTKDGYLDYQIHVPAPDANKMDIEMIECAGTVTDADGNVYQTVKIGDQVWTTSSLRTTKYNDGTPIPNVTDDKEWQSVFRPRHGATTTTIPNMERRDCCTTGGPRAIRRLRPKAGMCPRLRNNWPFAGTWYTMDITAMEPNTPNGRATAIIPGTGKQGRQIGGGKNWLGVSDRRQTRKYWEKELLISERPELNNKTGFNCLPNGARWNDGSFHNLTGSYYMWSSTESEFPNKAWLSSVHNWSRYLGDSHHVKETGFGIRLLKDKE
jgi:hypothetical protein